jgi:hypothetical protein
VISLKHPATGHEVRTDEASVKFWEAAGYRPAEQEKPKSAPRKRAAKKSDN